MKKKYSILEIKFFLRAYYLLERIILKLSLKSDGQAFKRHLMGNVFFCQNKWSYLSALKEIYIDECYKISHPFPVNSVLDVGANLGFSVAYLKNNFPDAKIIAIEADPSIFEYLQRNVAANQFKDVTLINGAAWTEDGEMSFFQDHSQGGSLLKSGVHKSEMLVKTIDLKKIIETSENWDLLKIDIEGAEIKIINHISQDLKKFKAVFIEYHEDKNKIGNLSSILSALEQAGFKYSIGPIFGSKNLFNSYFSNNSFDLQLNIHAIKKEYLHI